MRSLLLTPIFLLGLYGCGGPSSYYPLGSAEIVPAPTPAERQGTLYIYRLWQPGSDRTRVSYYVNEELVATLEALQYTWVQLPVGEYRVTARVTGLFKDDWVPPKQVQVERQRASFVSAATRFDGVESFRFAPIILSAHKIAYVPIADTAMVEAGKLWVYSEDGFTERLNGYRYVPPVGEIRRSKP